ncbi:hypothetical protein ACFX1X_022883 [Malus domestica]
MPLDLRCSVKAHEDAVNALAVLNDGTVYTGSTDCRIWVWSKPSGKTKKTGAGWDLGWVVLVLSLGKTE